MVSQPNKRVLKRLTVPILSVLVPNLSSRPSSAVLPVLCVSRVEIAPNDTLVEFGPRDVAERGDGILMGKEPASRMVIQREQGEESAVN